MRKTTVYLPDQLKVSLERYAAERGLSEAEVIREAIGGLVDRDERPRPRLPLVEKGLGDPSMAERVDELLAGFGES